jgi:hypothetical protein
LRSKISREIENLSLRLDDAGAAHLLVLAEDLDDVYLMATQFGECSSGPRDTTLCDPVEKLADIHD